MKAERLHTSVRGDVEPTIVLLHHFGGSGRAWDEVVAQLAPHHRCVTIDLRGFGRSQGLPAAASIADHVRDALEAICALRVERYVLAGHSMGGKIALAAAVARPPGLVGVLLAAPSPPSPEPMREAERQRTLASFGDKAAAEALLHRITVRPLSKSSQHHFVSDSLAASRAAWRWWLESGSREDFEADARRIAAPVRIVIGAGDPVIDLEVTRSAIAEVISGSELIEILEAGHLLPMEAPSELAAAMQSFIAGLPQPAGKSDRQACAGRSGGGGEAEAQA